ncbi:MAG: DnaD domain protein [Chloroflexota bacterium]|nr:DnaD domain protein [Chloroflexota bacterium]
MKPIAGFPPRMEFTPIPNFFFSTLLPQIEDMAELKVTLHILGTLYHKKGSPRFVTLRELLASKSLMSGFDESAEADKALRAALDMAAQRGTFLHVTLDRDGAAEDIYLLNTEANRQVTAKIQSGELPLPGLKVTGTPYVKLAELPDIFTLYEQNIGLLTPMVAEELRDAAKQYPESWIREAIKEAVNLNKRNWRYIAAILERWSAEGKSDGAYQRDSTKKEDPDKYVKGKYGHMVQR